MSDASRTIIKYTDTALPTSGTTVTLFNSVTAMTGVAGRASGFEQLGQKWFQYAVVYNSGGAATLSVTGDYSLDGGSNWINFYTKAITINTFTGDEVYIGQFKDVRFRAAIATADLTVLSLNLALDMQKSSSQAATTDTINT